MPIRLLPLLSTLPTLFALSAGGEDFPLERHIPADFHSRYLSVSPRLNWSLTDFEQDRPETGWGGDREQAGMALALRHGTELSSRRLRWSLGNGAEFQRDGSDYGNRDGTTLSDGTRVIQEGKGDSRSWRYGFHAHPSAQWFPRERMFLSGSAETRFHHHPALPGHWSQRGLALPPAGSPDSAVFRHTRGEAEDASLEAAFRARAAAGFGRIDQVGFAARVLHVFDRIVEVTGRPVRISPKEMHALEAFVEARRKQRGFADARRAALHDLESLEAFLRERGMADSTGPGSRGVAGSLPARALLAMADEYLLAAAPRRESGFEAKLQPFLAWSWNDRRYHELRRENSRTFPAGSVPAGLPDPAILDPALARDSELRERHFTEERILGLGLEAAWRRPWRRRFQADANAWARASRIRREYGMSRSSESIGIAPPSRSGGQLAYEHPLLEGNWDGMLSWYPDSRTRIAGGAGGHLSRSLDYLGSKAGLRALLGREPTLEAWRIHHRLHAEVEYQPGYRVSLRADATAGIDWSLARDRVPGSLEEAAMPSAWGSRSLERHLRFGTWVTYYLF